MKRSHSQLEESSSSSLLDPGQPWDVRFGFDPEVQPASQLMGHLKVPLEQLVQWFKRPEPRLAAWVTGSAGAGKTSLIRALAVNQAATFVDLNEYSKEQLRIKMSNSDVGSMGQERRSSPVLYYWTPGASTSVKELLQTVISTKLSGTSGLVRILLETNESQPDASLLGTLGAKNASIFRVPSPGEMQIKGKLSQVAFSVKGPRDPILSIVVSRASGDVRQALLQYQLMCKLSEAPTQEQSKLGTAKDAIFPSELEQVRLFVTAVRTRKVPSAVQASRKYFSPSEIQLGAQEMIRGVWRDLDRATTAEEVITQRTAVDLFCDSFSLSDMIHAPINKNHGEYHRDFPEYWNVLGLCRPLVATRAAGVILTAEPERVSYYHYARPKAHASAKTKTKKKSKAKKEQPQPVTRPRKPNRDAQSEFFIALIEKSRN